MIVHHGDGDKGTAIGLSAWIDHDLWLADDALDNARTGHHE